MINIFIIFLAELFSLVSKYIFADTLLERRSQSKSRTLICWVLYFIADNIFSYLFTFPPIFYIPVYFVLTCILFNALYTDTLKKDLLIMSFLYLAGIVSEFFIVEIGILAGIKYETIIINGENSFLFIFASRLIFFTFIRIFLHINKNKYHSNTSFFEWFSITLIPVSGSITLIAFAAHNRILNIAASIIILIANLTNYFMYIQIQKKSEADARIHFLEEQKHMYVSQYDHIFQLWNDNRLFRHELKNKYLYETHLLECQQYEKLHDVYSESIQLLNAAPLYITTGISALDSLLNCKFSLAHSKGIRITHHLQIEDFNLSESDYYMILGNLLDNAIEGSLMVAEESRYITLSIKEISSTLYIHIENQYNSNLLQFNGQDFLSTKEDSKNHGMGVSLVQSVVQKYNGKMDISTADDCFSVDILLFL